MKNFLNVLKKYQKQVLKKFKLQLCKISLINFMNNNFQKEKFSNAKRYLLIVKNKIILYKNVNLCKF